MARSAGEKRSIWLRLFRAALSFALLPTHRADLIFELDREYDSRARGSSSRRAELWYVGQVIRSMPFALTLRGLRAKAWLGSLLGDLRFALRRWRARPVSTATVIATLAIGIAATTSVFTIVDQVLMRPLPWKDPGRLVNVFVVRPQWQSSAVLSAKWQRGELSWPMWDALRERRAPAGIASSGDGGDGGVVGSADVAVWFVSAGILGGDRNTVVHVVSASTSLLPTLGVTMLAGHPFSDGADRIDTGEVLISNEMWRDRFAAAPTVIGQTLALDGGSRVIVGVLPASFDLDGDRPDAIVPLGVTAEDSRHAGTFFLKAVLRLQPGESRDAAEAVVNPIVQEGHAAAEVHARLAPLNADQRAALRRPLVALLLAGALLLVLACANIAGILLGDAASRRGEMALRLSLGASRARLCRQLLSESALLAVAAAINGVLFASWLTPVLVRIAPVDVASAMLVTMDGRVFGFALIAAMVATLLFGTAPALALSSRSLNGRLRSASRGQTGDRASWHGAMVAVQVSLTLILLVGAALLALTAMRLRSVPVGFNDANLFVATVRTTDAQSTTHPSPDAMIAALELSPSIVRAAGTATAPFSGATNSSALRIGEGSAARQAVAERQLVTATYFDTLGIALRKGRGFNASDRAGDFVAVVSAEFERRYLSGGAVGASIAINGRPATVIGVVADATQRRFGDRVVPAFYVLDRQVPLWRVNQFIVRTENGGADSAGAIRRALEQADPSVAVSSVQPMSSLMRSSLAAEQFRAVLASAFALAALLLGASGIYGLIAREAARRRREVGLRLALGAQRLQVVRLIAAQTIRPVVIGIAAGLPLALAAAQSISTMFFEVSVATWQVPLAATVTVCAAAVLAAAWPARNLSRMDPSDALRDS